MKFKVFRASNTKKIWEIEIKTIEEIVKLSKKYKPEGRGYYGGLIINGNEIEIYDNWLE